MAPDITLLLMLIITAFPTLPITETTILINHIGVVPWGKEDNLK